MKGQFAISLSGRDKGRVFMIVETHEEGYVSLADGKLRRLEKPKRKKLKHIKLLCKEAAEIPQTDKGLYELIKNISQS